MSLSKNKLKLEVKSSEADIAKFISSQKNAEIVLASANVLSPNKLVTFGTVAEDQSSNFFQLKTIIGTNETPSMASFNAINTDLSNTTIIRGNVIIEGSTLSLGTVILNDETDTSFSNIQPKSSNSNLISSRYSSLLYSNIQNISNVIIDSYDTIDKQLFSNIAKTFTVQRLFEGISFTSFSDSDFDNILQTKTIDNISKGSSNKYIVNNKYHSNLTINTDIIASNFITESIEANDIYASMYYADGSRLTNIYKGDNTTSTIIEMPTASNLYYTVERAQPIIDGSNIDTSNYILYLSSQTNAYLNTNELNLSNYNSKTLNDLTKLKENDNTSNEINNTISLLLEQTLITYEDLSNISADICVEYSNITDRSISNLENYLQISSNILNNNLIYNINNLSNYIQISEQNNSLDIFVESNILLDLTSVFSNALITYLEESYMNNEYHINHSSNVIDEKLKESLLNNSNNIENTIQQINDYLYNIILITSNNISTENDYLNTYITKSNNNQRIINENASNYLTDQINVEYINTSNSILSSEISLSNLIITNYEIYSNIILDTSNNTSNISDIIQLDLERDEINVSNYIITYSNYFITTMNEIFNQQIDDISQDILNVSNEVASRIDSLDTDKIPEQNKKYLTSNYFYNKILSYTLDNLQIGENKKYIINNIHPDNLTVASNLYASNLTLIGPETFYIKNSLNINTLEVLTYANEPALLVRQNANVSNILETYNYQSNLIFVVSQNGVGIGKTNPIYELEVNGVIKATSFIGSGVNLHSVNLSDKSTSELAEDPNGLHRYYTDERANIIIEGSNINISNYIYDTSNTLINKGNKYVLNGVNYWINTSNNIIKTNIEKDNSQSNYTLSTSNIIMQKAYQLIINNNYSNYMLNTSNKTINLINTFNWQQTGYVSMTSNQQAIKNQQENINNSNYILLFSNIFSQTASNNNRVNYGVSNYITIASNQLFQSYIVLQNQQSNYIINTSNYFANTINQYRLNTSNYIPFNSNINFLQFISSNIDTCNYIKLSSNVLISQISNYITNPATSSTGSQYINRWQEPTLYITTSTTSYIPFNYIVYKDGVVGIGTTIPTASLDISTQNVSKNSVKVNNDIWAQNGLIYSSDIRIKKDIVDLNDQDALNQILSIQPKIYEYIDTKRHRGKRDVYGFIAQQIAEIIPNAVTLQTDAIPDLYCFGTVYNNVLMFNDDIEGLDEIVKIDSKVAIIYENKKYTLLIEDIYSTNIFRVDNIYNLNGPVFIYGSVVNDFHTVDKNYIYTLNVCATQDLHRVQGNIKERIVNLKEKYKINEIMNLENELDRYNNESSNSIDIVKMLSHKRDDQNKEYGTLYNINQQFSNLINNPVDISIVSNRIESLRIYNERLNSENILISSNISVLKNRVSMMNNKIQLIREILQRYNLI
jgi:hypothetical protein